MGAESDSVSSAGRTVAATPTAQVRRLKRVVSHVSAVRGVHLLLQVTLDTLANATCEFDYVSLLHER